MFEILVEMSESGLEFTSEELESIIVRQAD